MTFIEEIAPYIQKYAPKYGISVCSPIIAQAILESGHGTSELAQAADNYFGIKWHEGRCPTSSGCYVKQGSEQNPDGSYVASVMKWCIFPDMESCVIGYFDFLGNASGGRYDNLIGITDPRTYLETIKADGYATSHKYVENLMKVIQDYDLTMYDRGQAMRSYSPLCNEIVAFGGVNSNPRLNPVSKITIHHMAGVMKAGDCARMHMRSSGSSANYYIGNDGTICGGVAEDRRAWTSGTGPNKGTNDHMAITIEVSNSEREGVWPISDAAYRSLIRLCAEICTYYKINPHYNGTPNGTLTTHKMFQSTACPGPYLDGLHKSGQIERDILAAMGNVEIPTEPVKPVEKVLYRVQVGAYKIKQNAINQLAKVGEGIIVQYGDLYKVQVGAFAVRENADRKAAELRKKGFSTYITEKGGDMVT